MARRKLNIDEDKKAILQSISLHFGIALVLTLSVVIGHQAIPTPALDQPIIEAQFIDAQAIYDKQQAAIAAEQERLREQERQRQAERKRQQEAERKREAEAKAKREREEKARQQRELERRAQEAAEQKRRDEERRKREAEEKAKRDAERKQQEELDRLMQEQLAQEQAAQAARRSQRVLSEVERYQALIHATIQRYLYDADSFAGKTCVINLRLATTGVVTQATIVEGDPALCRASRSAALRPDRLPVPDDLDVYEEIKEITLRVSPKI